MHAVVQSHLHIHNQHTYSLQIRLVTAAVHRNRRWQTNNLSKDGPQDLGLRGYSPRPGRVFKAEQNDNKKPRKASNFPFAAIVSLLHIWLPQHCYKWEKHKTSHSIAILQACHNLILQTHGPTKLIDCVWCGAMHCMTGITALAAACCCYQNVCPCLSSSHLWRSSWTQPPFRQVGPECQRLF